MKICYLIGTVPLITVVLSCTERIEIDVDEGNSRLVVDGSITTDTMAHAIALSSTSDYFSNQPAPMVTGAMVTISDSDSTYFLKETLPGIYRTDSCVFGVTGREYTLKIRLAIAIGGYSDYLAKATILPSSALDSIHLFFYPTLSEKGMWAVRCYFQDTPNNDYYRFLVYRNVEMVTDSLYEWFVTDDRFYNGNYISGATIAALHQHQSDEALASGDRITVELNGLDKEYADFVLNAQSELMGSYPLFSGPPANVKGNISNGAIGFFAAYSISRASRIVPSYFKR